MMFSYVFSTASSLFYLQAVNNEDKATENSPIHPKHIAWSPQPYPSAQEQKSCDVLKSSLSDDRFYTPEMLQVLSSDDLYCILGVPRSLTIDKVTIRRAYLSRSRACHPDKFPGNPDATCAFQKVSVAYDVLSNPSSKRTYDSRPAHSYPKYDFFSQSSPHADETLKGVLLSVFSEFLEGDFEMIRTFLRAISDLNPSLELGDDGINSVLSVLLSVRERILTCRTCVVALHSELTRALEIQSAFRQLSYFDIAGRSRLTIQLTRITISLPVTLENAVQAQYTNPASTHPTNHNREKETNKFALLPRRVVLLIRGIDVVLDRMERILG
ncbi:DnaJ domain-containing protein [Suillus paluster]|uniref:DnaJ domain-containing protein n=1 Tax=Suillus paluster TaxID=48578 RepID=UPI001B86F391|nr:DnaJ domain-containing protein [Suillus paluster]KAG1725364.1 DnaJ domain-containing protein [Suillus paluster]